MIALPAAPAAAPKRQLFVGTSLVTSAIAMFFAGMLGIYLKFRDASPYVKNISGRASHDWVPKNVKIPQVPSNMILVTLCFGCLLVSAAIASARRDNHSSTAIMLFMCAVMAIAVINAQALVYKRMGMALRAGTYQLLFYTITGAFVACAIGALVYSLTTAFRYLGGRSQDLQVVISLAVYWYVITAVFVAVWIVIYVTK
jgi:heme/copper-type cytochrome/quinol oxidase subunit 3